MVYKKNIAKYFFFTFLIYFYVWMPIWVVFFQDKGMNLYQIGLLDAAGYLLIALAEIPTGIVADKFGKKYSLAVGALFYGIGMFAITSSAFSFWFILGFVMWNISNPFFSGATTALLYDSLTFLNRKDDFQKLMGRSRAVTQIAQISGSIIGGIIASYSLKLCFIIAGILSIVAAIVALTMKEPIIDDEEIDIRKEKYWNIIKKAFSITVKNPSLRYLIIFSSLLSCFTFLLTYTIYQPYSLEVGFSLTTLGFLVFFIKGASILGNLWTDKLSKLVDNRYLIYVLPLIISIGMVLMGAITSKISIIFLIIISLASGSISPSISKLINDDIPSTHRATILSFEGLLWTGLIAVLEPVVLFIANFTNVKVALLISGLTLLVLSSAIYFLWLRSKNVETSGYSSEV